MSPTEPLGVMTAMPDEAAALLEGVSPGAERIEHGRRVFTVGELWGTPVVIVVARCGKVSAAATVTELIVRFGVGTVVCTGVAGARNRGLQVAQGVAVVFLDAGDTLMPRALMAWHNRLRQAGAGLGLARFRMGDAETVHSGLHDTAAMPTERREDPTGFEPNPAEGLVLHGHPSAKIFDRALLQRVGDFPEGALSTTHLLLRALAEVQRVVFLPAFPVRIAIRPATRTQWRTPVRAGDLRAALEAIALDPRLNLSPGGLARLWARLVWEKVIHADWPEAEAALFEAEVRTLSRSVPGLGPDTPLDTFIGPRVRELLGLAG